MCKNLYRCFAIFDTSGPWNSHYVPCLWYVQEQFLPNLFLQALKRMFIHFFTIKLVHCTLGTYFHMLQTLKFNGENQKTRIIKLYRTVRKMLRTNIIYVRAKDRDNYIQFACWREKENCQVFDQLVFDYLSRFLASA